jgi:hypothetical protein
LQDISFTKQEGPKEALEESLGRKLIAVLANTLDKEFEVDSKEDITK